MKVGGPSHPLDCSQSPIFSWDRLDIPRLTATAILIFKCTEGAGAGDYSSRWGWGGGDKKFLSLPPKLTPHPLSSFDTHARWQPVTQSARARRSYGKIEDCEQSTHPHPQFRIIMSHFIYFHSYRISTSNTNFQPPKFTIIIEININNNNIIITYLDFSRPMPSQSSWGNRLHNSV